MWEDVLEAVAVQLVDPQLLGRGVGVWEDLLEAVAVQLVDLPLHLQHLLQIQAYLKDLQM